MTDRMPLDAYGRMTEPDVLIPACGEADSFSGFPKRSISESMPARAGRSEWVQRFRFGKTTRRMI
jgi:hypothetical protein